MSPAAAWWLAKTNKGYTPVAISADTMRLPPSGMPSPHSSNDPPDDDPLKRKYQPPIQMRAYVAGVGRMDLTTVRTPHQQGEPSGEARGSDFAQRRFQDVFESGPAPGSAGAAVSLAAAK